MEDRFKIIKFFVSNTWQKIIEKGKSNLEYPLTFNYSKNRKIQLLFHLHLRIAISILFILMIFFFRTSVTKFFNHTAYMSIALILFFVFFYFRHGIDFWLGLPEWVRWVVNTVVSGQWYGPLRWRSVFSVEWWLSSLQVSSSSAVDRWFDFRKFEITWVFILSWVFQFSHHIYWIWIELWFHSSRMVDEIEEKVVW